MVDKKELDININNGGSSDTSKSSERSSSGENKSIFQKRVRTAHNGIDIVGRIKDIVENNVYEHVKKNVINAGKDFDNNADAKAAANKKANAAGLAVATFAKIAENTVTTSIGIAGMFVDEGTQNAISNGGMVANKALSAIGTIGAGAAYGPAGAIIAAVGVAANEALSMAKAAFENSKQNSIKAAETTRITDRLGYIETGYNR